jgi:hypothetical protein
MAANTCQQWSWNYAHIYISQPTCQMGTRQVLAYWLKHIYILLFKF